MAAEVVQMQRHTEHLNISKILQVTESLENILHGCFGPEGGQVLFIKSTGDLLITKDGRRILESLLLDHPVARMIVNSASRHYSITGDGVKSFVLLLCAVLRELQTTADKNEDLHLSGKTTLVNQYQRQSHALRRLSNLLLTFHSRVLDHIIAEHLSPHFLSVFRHMEGNIALCRTSVQQILDTYFSGRTGCHLQGFISKLACEYFYNCFLDIGDIPSVVSLVTKYFSELLTEVSGLPVADSRILPGLILHRTFSVYCPAEGEVRAIIVTEQISRCLSDTDIDFVISSDLQLQQSQLFIRLRTESVLKQFQQKEVKVIFSSVKQHEIVLYYAKLSGISIVDCLPSEEIDLLCKIAGVSQMSNLPNEDFQTETFPAASCKPVVIGCKKYVHLVFQSSLAFRPHSLVLCGPVKGLTEQLVSAFHGAFKMLTQLFHPFTTIQEQPPNNAESYFPKGAILTKEQSVTCNGCQNDSAGLKCHLENNDQAVHILPTLSEGKDSACASRECSAHLSPSYRCEDTGNTCFDELRRKTHQEPFIIHGDSSSSSTDSASTIPFANVGQVFPGAGIFELLLKDYLHKFAKTCHDTELASICTMFGNALLCIPRQMYKAKTGQVHLPLYYLQCTQKMKSIDSLNVAETGLEPVSCKYQLLASVLQCISQLVTIDLIVGVKRSPCSHSEETDQDMLLEDR
ncbi:BBSome complex assembly protein BBS10 isoform X2 [Phyllobates terribilis]|uniref:BBSome complex assembly protein BBS10 isoform X2 n=1 Tax=Phyllobates terribilis TaxID=111132 RepID=UPI003CCAE14A